ncbi:MAG: oligosaccharide repeat unit polymerase [Bacteroidales bacterium]|nr:oligosaccharide repeat unit polymerase [Bacteroidales bacterium]
MADYFNLILYLVALIHAYRRAKTINVYIFLLSAYTITAFFISYITATETPEFSNTTFFPYIYLFACIMISLKPFQSLNIAERIDVNETWLLKTLMYIYIISSFISIYLTIPKTIELIQEGGWNMIRQAIYDDGVAGQLYSSIFEKLCKNISVFLAPFGILMCFYYLTKEHKNLKIITLLFVSWIGFDFVNATLLASRGIVLFSMLRVALIFILFKNIISSNVKKVLFGALVLVFIPLFAYIIIVSMSRFGETSDGTGGTILRYVGHSMAAFNQGIMGTMHSYAYGRYFFSSFSNVFSFDPIYDSLKLGCTHGSSFMTFVGSFYIDFGPFFTFLFLIFLSFFLGNFTRKKKIKLSDLIIIIYFASFFLEGVFVIGRGQAFAWLMTGILYYLIRFIEKTSKKITND